MNPFIQSIFALIFLWVVAKSARFGVEAGIYKRSSERTVPGTISVREALLSTHQDWVKWGTYRNIV